MDEKSPCERCSGTGTEVMAEIDMDLIEDQLDWIKKKIKKILQAMSLPED